MRAISRSTIKACIRAASALIVLAALATVPAAADTNRIVIRVNDRIATLYDYEQARLRKIEALRRSELPPEQLQQRLADVGLEVMSDLFEEMLLLSRGDQIDAEPGPDEIAEAVQRARESADIESEEEFADALAVSGFTLETFRRHLAKTLMMNGVMGAEVRPRIRLSEEDLRRYYQANLEDYRLPVQLNVREFVVLETATTQEQDRQAIADDIRGRLLAGEDADVLLGEYTDKGLTTPWIDLGWVEEEDLDSTLAEAIWELPAGAVSPPVDARGGTHVAQIIERQEATIQDFASVAEEIEEIETSRRYQAEIGEYLAELERDSYVVIQPPPEAASFRSVLSQRREQGLEVDEREAALAGAGLITDSGTEDDSEGADEPEDGSGSGRS